MEIKIEILSENLKSVFESFTQSNVKPSLGETYSPDGELSFTYISGYDDEFINNEILVFVIGNITGLGINLLSSYIYDKLKNDDSAKLLINGSEVKIDKNLIKDFLQFLGKKNKKSS